MEHILPPAPTRIPELKTGCKGWGRHSFSGTAGLSCLGAESSTESTVALHWSEQNEPVELLPEKSRKSPLFPSLSLHVCMHVRVCERVCVRAG